MAERAESLRSSGGKLRGCSVGSRCWREEPETLGKVRLFLAEVEPEPEGLFENAAAFEFSSFALLPVDLEVCDFFRGWRACGGSMGSASFGVVVFLREEDFFWRFGEEVHLLDTFAEDFP